MGTIVSPSGASCNVAASDAAINNVPNLRTFLSKSLDVAAKAKKPIAQAEKILNKQITTIATNPQRYTPAAIQQCTVNLDKAVQNTPNVDVLENLTNTGYMPPDATTYQEALLEAVQSGVAQIAPVFTDKNGVVGEGRLHFPGEESFNIPIRGQPNGSEGAPVYRNDVSGRGNNRVFNPEAGFDVGLAFYGGQSGTLMDIKNLQIGADNKVQPAQNINSIVDIHASGGPSAFSQLAGALAFSYLAPGLGSVIAEGLGAAGIAVSSEAATAIARAGINIAGGQDPTTAIRDAITGAIIDTGSRDIAGEIQKGVQAMSDDKYMALLVGGAIGSAFSSAAKTAAKGGSSQDILNAAVAGAAGSGVATETESRTLGQAIAGGLTGGTQGAVMGAATALGTEAAKGGATTTPGGVPLPPGGKVGVTWSVDSTGNALVQYEDGTTAVVQVDPSVQPGTSISVDPATNVATVVSPSSVTTGGAQVAGPGGMSAQTVASMPEMQPRQGETAGDVKESTDADGITYYTRTIISTLPDGTKTSYEIQYDPGAESGKQISYVTGSVPKGEGGAFPTEGGGAVTVQSSYTRPGTEVGGGETTPGGAIAGGKTDESIVYPNIIDITAGYPYKIGQGLDAGVTGGGVTGGLPTTGGPSPSTQEKGIPDQISQVSGGGVGGQETGGVVYPNIVDITAGYPYKIGQGLDAGAGGAGTRDRQIMDLTGIGGEGGGAGGTGGGGVGGGGDGGVGVGVEEEPISDVPPEKTAEEPGAGKEPSPYLITGGISPRMKARAPGRAAATALQTPFERSLITSGLTSYRGAGEIESPETGGKRTTAWNEASLRLKDALGI